MSLSNSNCKECGHPTEWAPDIGSAVCTQCGTLVDSSQQSALTSSIDLFNSHDAPSTSTYTRPTPLKSICRNAAWDLPGQGVNSRNERNKFTTHDLIRTLSNRLGHHGVATRAQAIFDLAMQRTSMKWGKATKLAAGAAFVFAMREQRRGDRTHHVAYLLQEPAIALKRTQLHLLPHLDLALPRTQPSAHLPALASHLSVLTSALPASLPKDTLAFLRPLVLSPAALQNILRTARGLHDIPALDSCIFNGPSAGPTACALILLALEARARPPRSAPHVLALAGQLGAALGTRGAAVMARYRMLVDIVEEGAVRVPWLANSSPTGAKFVSRRSGVAKAALDVLQFHDDVQRAEIAERGGPIHVDIREDDEGSVEWANQGEDEAALDDLIANVELKMTDNTWAVPCMPNGVYEAGGTSVGPMRRYKKPRTPTGQATCFLLDPLAHCAPAPMALAHTSYLLSSDAATVSVPTRLQLLAVERGNAEAIGDDELFSDGELEGIVLGADEQAGEELERRAQTLQMMWGEEDTEATTEVAGGKGTKRVGNGRVDMSKLTAR